MKKFGLIGYPLGHSFSKKYFTERFEKAGNADDHEYALYEIQNIEGLADIVQQTEGLVGLNVTIPHKVNVLPFLSEIDPAAKKIGAVNVLKVLEGKKLKGYNSDYYGFRRSLEEFTAGNMPTAALVLGNGGAAKAILVALENLGIPFYLVSRNPEKGGISYAEANAKLGETPLVINCTPLGTYPNIEAAPALDYSKLTARHYLYDLVYNPEVTRFMQEGLDRGAKVINGYKMLVYQAEKSWEIWNDL
jgi:shikimate dehydrogenase